MERASQAHRTLSIKQLRKLFYPKIMGDWNEIDFAFLFDILHFYWGIFDIKSAKLQFAGLHIK